MSISKAALFSTTMLFATGLAGATFAQSTTTPDKATAVEEVVITARTGTRLKIPQQQYSAPNPITTITSATLRERGVTDLADYLKSIPALNNSLVPESYANAGDRGSVGLEEANLRNLGTQRTLVLVNGLRHVAGDPGTAAVDLNSIPFLLIDHVDIETGGASAIYGADAVSGVVNFIMKDNFEGVDIRGQAGMATEGAGESQQISGLVGHNFSEGRGNFTFDVEAENTRPVNTTDRSYQTPDNAESLVVNPNAGQPGQPMMIFAKNVRYKDSAEGGAVYTNFNTATSFSGVSFQGDGQPWVDGIDGGDDSMIGGSGTLEDRYREQLLPAGKRFLLNTTAHFDVTPKIQVFTDVKWANTETIFKSQPSFNYGIFEPIDNPYIPASIVADAETPGGLGTPEGAAAAGLPGPGVLVGRDNFDLGDVVEDITRNTYRVVVGAKGAATPWLDYQAAYTYGRTDTNDVERNNRIEERFYAAADAVRDPSTGKIVCRSTLDPSAVPYGDPFFGEAPIPDYPATFTPGPNSGCVPINIFGTGGISQAAKNWINQETVQRSSIEQQDISGYISGRSTPLFELPAGPISFDLGGEYRREISMYHASAIQQQATADQFNISFLGQGTDTGGSFDVAEAFGEVHVPILKDVFLAKEFSLEGAYRFSHYSTAGNTHTYEGRAEWKPIDSFMLRGTIARAVRAPNINELFQPQVQTYATIVDPCDTEDIGIGKPPRVGNCTADLAALGISTNGFENTLSSSVAGTIGGNPELKPETADTFTYGIVFTPTPIRNLYFSIDYYNISLKQAIETFDAQEIVDECVDLPQPNNFCAAMHRDPATGFIDHFVQQYINIAGYKTSGFEFKMNYRLDPKNFGITADIGHFDIQVQGNKLEEYTYDAFPSSPPQKEIGTTTSTFGDNPLWSVNLDVDWVIHNFTIHYGFDYASALRRFSQDTQRSEPNYVASQYFFFSPTEVHSLQVRYDFDKRYSVFAGADNLTDQQPDIDNPQPSEPVSPLGRFIYLGAEARF
jgi:outer membrane receptor protein involved in Fe transport